jgi:hypothetical protein
MQEKGISVSLRDKLRERARPFLERGEQVQEVFPAQAGLPPYLANLPLFGALGALLLQGALVRRLIIVTDRAILLLDADKMNGTKPKALVRRLPRRTRLGPVRRGLPWAPIQLGGSRLWVHMRYHPDVEAADAAAPRLTGGS